MVLVFGGQSYFWKSIENSMEHNTAGKYIFICICTLCRHRKYMQKCDVRVCRMACFGVRTGVQTVA